MPAVMAVAVFVPVAAAALFGVRFDCGRALHYLHVLEVVARLGNL